MDAEGATYDFIFMAKSRRHATRQARAWMTRLEWVATLVEITPMLKVDQRGAVRGRRLLAVAGVTFAVSGITIAGTMILALSLEGAL
jgi:hypothetical protein